MSRKDSGKKLQALSAPTQALVSAAAMHTLFTGSARYSPGRAWAGDQGWSGPKLQYSHPGTGNWGLRDRGGNGMDIHLPFLWKGPERRGEG